MKLLFVGDMRSPFIRQDYQLLQDMGHQLRPFDLGEHAVSFRQVPQYLIDTLMEAGQVQASDAIWVWFADYPAVPFLLLAKLFRKPAVVNVGGFEVYAAPEIGYGNQLKTIRGAVTRWILRNADRIIVPSYAYANITKALVPGIDVHVIPGFVPRDLVDHPLPEKTNQAITAICQSSTGQLKGIDTFKAAALFSEVPMMVIKNKPHEELMEILRQSKVYCQLSYTESFGVTLLEAMACGCVPVVTDRDALPEVVGKTGVIVPFGNIFETRNGIKEALTMDGNAARERALCFSEGVKKDLISNLLAGLRG